MCPKGLGQSWIYSNTVMQDYEDVKISSVTSQVQFLRTFEQDGVINWPRVVHLVPCTKTVPCVISNISLPLFQPLAINQIPGKKNPTASTHITQLKQHYNALTTFLSMIKHCKWSCHLIEAKNSGVIRGCYCMFTLQLPYRRLSYPISYFPNFTMTRQSSVIRFTSYA